MNVLIVESPAKAKTINKYLGDNYKVLASFGHIRDLFRTMLPSTRVRSGGGKGGFRGRVKKSACDSTPPSPPSPR